MECSEEEETRARPQNYSLLRGREGGGTRAAWYGRVEELDFLEGWHAAGWRAGGYTLFYD